MRLTKINKLLLKKYLKIWNKDSKFDSFINLFSLLIHSLSIVFIVFILSINNGFKDNITSIMDNVSGRTRIYENNNSFLTDDDYNKIIKYEKLDISKVVEKKCIAKYHNNSQSVLLTGLDTNELRVSSIKKFIYEGHYNDSSIIVGKLLCEKLDIKIGDNILLISLDSNSKKKIKKLNISGIFSTNIPDYDNHIVYGNIKFLNDFFFQDKIKYTYFVSNNEKSTFINNNLNNEYMVSSISDRNYSFYNWLNSYDNPIKLLIFFIFIISVMNMFNNNYYLVYNKKKQIQVLKIIGMSYDNLKKIFLIRSLIYSSMSSIVGLLCAYLILLIEKNYHFIKLPDYVYFINYLPIEINFHIMLFLFPYIILFTILSSWVSYKVQIKY